MHRKEIKKQKQKKMDIDRKDRLINYYSENQNQKQKQKKIAAENEHMYKIIFFFVILLLFLYEAEEAEEEMASFTKVGSTNAARCIAAL